MRVRIRGRVYRKKAEIAAAVHARLRGGVMVKNKEKQWILVEKREYGENARQNVMRSFFQSLFFSLRTWRIAALQKSARRFAVKKSRTAHRTARLFYKNSKISLYIFEKYHNGARAHGSKRRRLSIEAVILSVSPFFLNARSSGTLPTISELLPLMVMPASVISMMAKSGSR